jgi:hypothetical protein
MRIPLHSLCYLIRPLLVRDWRGETTTAPHTNILESVTFFNYSDNRLPTSRIYVEHRYSAKNNRFRELTTLRDSSRSCVFFKKIEKDKSEVIK